MVTARRGAALRAVRDHVRTVVCIAVASAVGFTLAPSGASADELTDQRQQVQAQLAQSQQSLGESTTQLNSAAIAVQSAQSELAAAQAELAATRVELRSAQVKDKAIAAKLEVAQAALAKAKAAVAAGQEKLNAEHDMAGAMVRDQYQQQTNLLPVAILVSSQSSADLGTRLQWSTTMFDTTQAYIERLTTLQAALKVERAKQVELETQMAADRKDAADNLLTQRRLERRAASETAGVAYLVQQRTEARAAAARAVVADQQQVKELNREQASVEHRIAVRIAKAKAAAARKAAAAKAAKLRAARAAAQAAARERAHQRAVAEKARRAAAAEDARIKAAERASRNASKKQRAAALKQIKIDKRVARAKRAQAARAATKAESKKTTKRSQSTNPKKRTRVSSGGGSSSGAHHGFIYPVNGPITSPYGRRFHPILHVWKLHDGTDFGAGCGTPIRAAHAGRVAEKYYNRAYGNRLMIDHGTINGRYVTTGYNHAQRYRVSVGDHVREGEVIGYVGATGYATGCHLHLMVWLDGSRVNPMGWLY